MENRSARLFIQWAVIWLALGVTYGLASAIQYVFPGLIRDLPFLAFGRIRPIHITLVAFGFLSMSHIAAFYYIIPNLARTKLWSEKLGMVTLYLWNAIIIGGILSFSNGITEGREYAELPWYLDYLLFITLGLVMINCFMTLARRAREELYVTQWYFIGTLIWMPAVYIIGNRAFIRLSGLNDAIANWFYGHNILGLWFTTVGVGVVYYLLPKLIRKPIYSHQLSMIGFWAIAVFYAPTGTHHILQSPVPEWLKAIAVMSSVGLVVPVVTVLTNFFLTMNGSWNKVADNITLRFVVAGAIHYLFTCIQGPFQATRFVNWYLHFTQWVVAHAHVALLGTFAFWMMALAYYVIPRIVGRPIFSKRGMLWHFWLTLIGFQGFFWSLTAAGLVQAAGWRYGFPVGTWSLTLLPYMVFRLLFGLMIVVGQYIFAWNIWQTVRYKENPALKELLKLPAREAIYQREAI